MKVGVEGPDNTPGLFIHKGNKMRRMSQTSHGLVTVIRVAQRRDLHTYRIHLQMNDPPKPTRLGRRSCVVTGLNWQVQQTNKDGWRYLIVQYVNLRCMKREDVL